MTVIQLTSIHIQLDFLMNISVSRFRFYQSSNTLMSNKELKKIYREITFLSMLITKIQL